MNPEINSPLRCIALLASLTLVGGCTGGTDKPSVGASAPATAAVVPTAPASTASAPSGPPVSIVSVSARVQDFVLTFDAIGTSTAVSSVDVKPQMAGTIAKVHVSEGQFVRAGQALFSLDPRSEEANVAKAQAQLARDEASLADARRQLARSRDLLAQNFVSQGAVDSAQTQVDAQAAAVQADRAALDAARVLLSHTRIHAPNAGRVGSVNLFAGSTVQANQTTLLTITQINPIDVAFNLPQRQLPDLLAALKAGDAKVTARLPDSSTSLTGRLQFVDSVVDAATGTIKAKARFDNAAQKLWPGLFVNVSLDAATVPDAVVVPTAAVIFSQRGSIVYVADNGRAALRPVKVLHSKGDLSAVTGVRPGERVVLDGRQNLRPGTPVVERQSDGASKGGARPAASAALAP